MMSQSVWKIAAIICGCSYISVALALVLGFPVAQEPNISMNNSYYVTYENAIELITSGYIDTSKPTVICFHGFGGSPNKQGINLLVNAYLQRDMNVCACDYSKEAAIGPILVLSYIASIVSAAYEVAWEVAIALRNLVQRGFNVKTLHLVGFSLGAHLCGNTGAFYETMTGDKIYRITGLDPAGPLFMYPSPRLCKENAEFVDIIHTDYGVGRNGMADTTGHSDFIVCPIEYNKNGVQPGCSPVIPFVTKKLSAEDVCSHLRALYLFLETLISTIQQLAAKAKDSAEVNCAGEYTNQNYHGTFYYCTNDKSPFGLGVAGLPAR